MESYVLYFLLAISCVMVPLLTNTLFLSNSRIYSEIHKFVLAILIGAAIFDIKWLVVIWPIFCAFGYLLFLKKDGLIFSFARLTTHLPFVFSLISALWFVTGVLDLKMLGYNPIFSFYAALHGAYLGWMFVGCLAFLSQSIPLPTFSRTVTHLCFICFLMIAFGIDGVPYIKAIGTVGLFIIAPLSILIYALGLNSDQKNARGLAFLSLLVILISMSLALSNHFFWPTLPRIIFWDANDGIDSWDLECHFCRAFIFLAVKLANNREVNAQENILFFDGFFVLCNRSVDLLMKIDTKEALRFSSQQGRFARTHLDAKLLDDPESIIFFRGGRVYRKSESIVHILKTLGGIYYVMGAVLGLMPFLILDKIYDLIAQNRYRIFGKRDECRIPDTETRRRMID